MSLINEALKKAQTDVSRGGPVNPMASSLASAHVRQEKKSPFLKLFALALFLGIAVWAVSLFLNSSEQAQPVVEVASASAVSNLETAPEVEAIAAPAEPESASAPEAPVAQSASAPLEALTATSDVAQAPAPSSPPASAAPVPEVSEPVTSPVASSPAVSPEEVPAAPAVAQAPAQTAPPAPPEPEPAQVAPKPVTDQALRDEIIYTLKQLEITAVMGDGSKARIMSGGQIHRAGELINLDLKIRFQGKKAKTLYFTDAAGEIYEKSL